MRVLTYSLLCDSQHALPRDAAHAPQRPVLHVSSPSRVAGITGWILQSGFLPQEHFQALALQLSGRTVETAVLHAGCQVLPLPGLPFCEAGYPFVLLLAAISRLCGAGLRCVMCVLVE